MRGWVGGSNQLVYAGLVGVEDLAGDRGVVGRGGAVLTGWVWSWEEEANEVGGASGREELVGGLGLNGMGRS